MPIRSLSLLLLALSAASPTHAGEDSWLGLDRELERISATTTSEQGPRIGGWILSHFASSSDFEASPSDLEGWRFRSIRLEFTDQLNADWSYKVSADYKDAVGAGSASLQDAFGTTAIGKRAHLRWGRFKEPLVDSGISGAASQLMVGRTFNGANSVGRQLGVMLFGTLEEDSVEWYLAAQNGTDGAGDEYQITLRGVWHALTAEHAGGTIHAFDKFQGARGSHGQTLLSLGAALQSDDDDPTTGEDRKKFALDAELTWRNLCLHAELVDYADGVADSSKFGALSGTGAGSFGLAGSEPVSVTLSYLFGERDEWEAALRLDDGDDVNDTSRWTAGFNYYQSGSYDARWQLNVSSFESDDDSLDGILIEGGLVIRI